MYRKNFFGYIPDRKSEWYGERKRSKEKKKQEIRNMKRSGAE